MAPRTLMWIAVILTGIFLVDTGWQVYALTQNKPVEWYSLALLVPIVHLVKKLSETKQAASADSRA